MGGKQYGTRVKGGGKKHIWTARWVISGIGAQRETYCRLGAFVCADVRICDSYYYYYYYYYHHRHIVYMTLYTLHTTAEMRSYFFSPSKICI